MPRLSSGSLGGSFDFVANRLPPPRSRPWCARPTFWASARAGPTASLRERGGRRLSPPCGGPRVCRTGSARLDSDDRGPGPAPSTVPWCHRPEGLMATHRRPGSLGPNVLPV